MSEYPPDWEVANLGTYLKETKERVSEGNTTPYSVSKVLGIVPQSEKFKKRVASNDISNYKIIRKGDFAYDPMLLWDGSINRMLREDTGAVSPAYVTFRVLDNSLDADYLLHFLKADTAKNFYKSISKGTNVRRQKAEFRDFASGEFAFPPLPEQKKIAEILSGIDQTITKLDSQKTKYDRLFASMLSEVFADLHKSHEIRRIGEICEVKRGASPRPIQSKKWWGDGRGWTRISDVTKSKKYLYKTKDRLSPEGEQRSVPINPGSIILSICATIGLPVIPKIPVCIHDGFVWFEGIEKEILPEFAYYFFLSVRDGLVSGRQTGTQGNLNTSIVSQQLIPIPPQSEQKRIIKLMSDMEFQAEKIDRKIQSHKNLKSSLSSDLLSGRKRVSI